MKRWVLFIIVFLIFICPVTVNATTTKKQVKDSKTAKKLYQYILSEGSSEWWAATAVGNGLAESGLNTKADGSYWGAFQFLGKKSEFQSWCKSNNRDQYDICAQYDWFMEKYRGSICETLTGLSTKKLKKDKTHIKDARSAAAYFALGMEGCTCWSGITTGSGHVWESAHPTDCGEFDFSVSGSKYGKVSLQQLERRAKNTEIVYEVFKGVKPSSGGENNSGGSDKADKEDKDVDTSKLADLQPIAANGIYTDEQLSQLMRLAESNIQVDFLDGATIDSLNQSDLSSLSNWKLSVESRGLKANIIKFLRILTVTVGILITIWMILIYLGFWFDRLNNIWDLDLVGVFTLGKLHTAIEDSDATFSLHNRAGKQVTVSHMNIVMICLLGIIFGVLIISGTFYKMIACLVNFVLRLLQG